MPTIGATRRSFVIGVAGAAAAAGFPLCRGASAAGATALIEADAQLRALIDRERTKILATMEKENIPGAAVCLVYDGKPVWIEGFGVTDRKSERRVSMDTIFSIQSTSKNMTTTAVMLAVQRGLLDLDKPITTWLPGFSVNSRFESKPQDKMTLRHLVSNRAGFTHEAPIGNNYDPSFANFESHIDSISQTWLRFPVGERFRYSNLGFDLAGYILQSVSRKPFAECLKTMLLDPLGMSDTTADTDGYAQRANRALGHQAGYDAVPLRIPLIPSGGVYASARDLASYLVFHLNKGRIAQRSLLDETLWNEMHSFSLPGAYSLGIAGGKLRFGDTDVRMHTHNGGGFGFGCVLRFYPQADLGLAVVFNRPVGAAYQFGAVLTDEILNRRYGRQRPRTRIDDFTAANVPQNELQKFSGNWLAREFTCDFKLKGGVLVLQRGEKEVPVRVTSPVDIALPGEGPMGDAVAMRYFPAPAGATAHMESVLGDGNLDYNDGPNDIPGPDKKEWDKYVGEYSIHYWGKPRDRVNVNRKNGYLYLNAIRLVEELKPGLFFTSDGEVVDFSQDRATWRNIPLRRA